MDTLLVHIEINKIAKCSSKPKLNERYNVNSFFNFKNFNFLSFFEKTRALLLMVENRENYETKCKIYFTSLRRSKMKMSRHVFTRK